MLKLPYTQTSKGNVIFNGLFLVNIVALGLEPTTPVKNKEGIYLLVHFLLYT